MALVKIARTDQVPQGEGRHFEADDHLIALFNLGEGEFYALDDICSHAHAYLSEGDVDEEDKTVECPRHGSTFELPTGDPVTLPATQPVRVYPVKVEGDDVLIELD
jgi:3-phenylpropionate/trans-cinnamate dioxygenase ferredoxin subunit